MKNARIIEKPYEELAAAIIKQAFEDLQRIKENPIISKRKKFKRSFAVIANLKSTGLLDYFGLDLNYMIEKLKGLNSPF